MPEDHPPFNPPRDPADTGGMNPLPWDYEGGTDSLRLWLSEAQWTAILHRIEQEAKDYQGPNRRNRARNRFPVRLRCVIRAQQPDGRSATYLVRSHNLSAGGLGFIHHQPLPQGSRCTIALQTEDGEGLIAAGRVAWTRQISEGDQPGFEVGIEFDKAIDPTPFVGTTSTPGSTT